MGRLCGEGVGVTGVGAVNRLLDRVAFFADEVDLEIDLVTERTRVRKPGVFLGLAKALIGVS